MSDAKTPPEPSIDEILATIRLIISDDEQGGTAAGGGLGEPASKAAETKPAASNAAETKAPEAGAAASKAADDDDVLELTEALNEDGTTRRLAPIGGGSSPRPAAVEPPPAAPRVEPQLRLRPSSASEPEPLRRDAPSLRLAPTPHAAGQAEPRLGREVPLGGGERTLEDIVGDTLRPLLQAWLDEHLQPIVERLVQAEITRVAREAAGRG